MSFTHLQVRSGYSLMNSTITIEKLVKRASELGFTALALTDEQVLYGVVPFYEACLKYNIKPIIGMVVNVEETDSTTPCILLAKNNTGYQQLIKLSTVIQVENQKIDLERINEYTEQLICILPIGTSGLKKLLQNQSYDMAKSYVECWTNVFREGQFYLGISDHGRQTEKNLNSLVKTFHDNIHIPVVAINDVRYLMERDVISYDCLQAMKNDELWELKQPSSQIRGRYLRSSEEMASLFSFWPEVIEQTNKIKHSCDVRFDFSGHFMPSYPVPTDQNAHTYLKDICWRQVKIKYDHMTEEVKKRLTYELHVIETLGYSDYFLIVADFVQFAKKENILVGPGRGSAAGSLVAYVLGITAVDPIKYDLLFERFLNPERVSMPDIDIDFSDRRRDEVIEYVRKKYGEAHVAQIITFGTFAARSLLRELMKTLDVNRYDFSYVLKHISLQGNRSIKESVKASQELNEYIKQSEKLKILFHIATKLEGLPRHISTHAAGIVITKERLIEHVPLTQGANEGLLTQFSMNDLEKIGLLKIDLLGLKNLSLIEQIIQSVKQVYNQQIDLLNFPANDEKTFRLLQKGKTNGVFQLESQGMKQVLTKLKPTSIDDIIAVNALYRPGPMEQIPTYIERKHRQQKVTYIHPDLAPILKNTYGVLIFQEQIMQIAHHFANFSLGEADLLRRAISKKQKNVMEDLKDAFINGCLQNGYDQLVAEQIFSWIVKFANYGFNKSHAVAYSKISYQLAFLKAHYPTNFFAELLSSVANQPEKVQLYIREAKEFGINVLPPSINQSFGKFTVEGDSIRIGLLSIKGVGQQTVKEIMRARQQKPFKNLFDFCLRISLRMINRHILENLIMVGAFDETYANRASLLASIDQALGGAELFGDTMNQANFFIDEMELEPTYIEMEDFTQAKKLADEKELIGFYISSHPLKQYRQNLAINGFVTMQYAKRVKKNKRYKSVGLIQSIRKTRTKRGESMAFLTIGDETDEMEAVVFPKLYRQVGHWLEEELVITIKGKINERNNRIQWVLDEITRFDDKKLSQLSRDQLFIKLTKEKSADGLMKIKECSRKYPGHTMIIMYHEKEKQTYRLGNNYLINPTNECLQELQQYYGLKNVVYQKKEQ